MIKLQFAFLVAWIGVTFSPAAVAVQSPDFGTVFDEHWECLRDNYPFFDLYGVDWEAERVEHRPRAVAAKNETEFAWELARLLSVLKDAHVEYMPPVKLFESWSIPNVRTVSMGHKVYAIEWQEGEEPIGPGEYRDDPKAYPEVVAIDGTELGSGVYILTAGAPGTWVQIRLRWPDGSESDHEVMRPEVSNLSPPSTHYGDRWVITGRVGSIGYMRVKTFDPSRGTLGPAGKMTPILRARLTELLDTEGLILDFQRNGGGAVGASDPFLSHFLDERRSYLWGNSGGQRRTLVPRSPRYRKPVVALVDERSASGGEWAARILRDAGRAVVVGGPSMGAEAAVHRSNGSDGSWIQYSAWPMVEPGVQSFQNTGVELDHPLPVTIEAARELGYDEALEETRRARYAKALELLGAPPEDLDALMNIVDEVEEDD